MGKIYYIDASKLWKRGGIVNAFSKVNRDSQAKSLDDPNEIISRRGSYITQDRSPSGVSSHWNSGKGSQSQSPEPHIDKTKLTLKTLGQIASLGNVKKIQGRNRQLTFKTVCKAIVGFIRQEKILRWAIGPIKLKQPHKFDLKRLKSYIDRSKAFTEGLAKTKAIEIRAPDPKKKPFGMDAIYKAATNLQQAKKLSTKKGGFLKSSSPKPTEVTNPPLSAQSHVPPPSVQDRRRSSVYPPSSYGPEWDRRYPGDYHPYDRPPPWEIFPHPGPSLPPWDRRYREDYDYYDRHLRYSGWEHGPDPVQFYDRQGYRDDYRSNYQRKQARDQYKFPEYSHGTDNIIDQEYETTLHSERYRRAPRDYPRRDRNGCPDRVIRNRSLSPRNGRYLRTADSSAEDYPRGREDFGYYSGNQTSKESGRKSPGQIVQKSDESGRKQSKDRRRPYSTSPRGFEQEQEKIPEEYMWGKSSRERGLRPQDYYGRAQGPPGQFEKRMHDVDLKRQDQTGEMAKLQSVAVYAAAMGGVNEEGWLLW